MSDQEKCRELFNETSEVDIVRQGRGLLWVGAKEIPDSTQEDIP